MYFTREKTNYTIVPEEIISYYNVERICKIFHVLPSLVFSVIFSVKFLPDEWPYYASKLEENEIIVPIVIFIIFIPIAIINGLIIEKVITKLNPRYLEYKNLLKNPNDFFM